MTTATRIVVVGAGQAGGWAAHTLRTEGFEGDIVLVGNEAHPPHERPPLSKAVLAGLAPAESTHLFKPDAVARLKLDERRGTAVQRIDRATKRVILAGGEGIAYGKLILCTGGHARTLAIPGAERAGIHVLRTIDDALSLRGALQRARRVAIIGGGWIGLEIAAAARKFGTEVVVVEMASRLCERTVPPEISDYLLRLHRMHGVEVVLNAGVVGVHPEDGGNGRVELTDGRVVACDVVVAGIGLVANDALARDAGLVCDNGVLVDAQCRSSDPDIFAAGDVAVAFNRWAGRRIRLESWQNAQDQGIAAARAALDLPVDYAPLPWFWSDQFGASVQIYGMPSPAHRTVLRGDSGVSPFVVFYLEGDKMRAAVGVDAVRELRVARRLIEREKPVRDADLRDPAVALGKL